MQRRDCNLTLVLLRPAKHSLIYVAYARQFFICFLPLASHAIEERIDFIKYKGNEDGDDDDDVDDGGHDV